jgi:hypothetical protein
MNGPDVGREFVDAAKPAHPSLIDETHQMDALFGVVNIPNVVWIDEEGVIVRPAEPGWPPPAPRPPRPASSSSSSSTSSTAPRRNFLSGGQDRAAYAGALRDWVANGRASAHYLTPAQVVERSHPRPIEVSEAAAHFELANHLWRAGERELAFAHFNASHRLQPENWTYKRQAWSTVSAERNDSEFARFIQGPGADDTEPWPFDSDFRTDTSKLQEGEYYPKTFD